MPPDYEKKLRLHIPENLSKLLVDVIFCLLDKSGFSRGEARRVAAMVDKDRKEYGGMFEAVIESFNEAREEGREEGFSKGREEGLSIAQEEVHQEKLRTAANLKQLGVSTEVIAQATGLSVEEIERL